MAAARVNIYGIDIELKQNFLSEFREWNEKSGQMPIDTRDKFFSNFTRRLVRAADESGGAKQRWYVGLFLDLMLSPATTSHILNSNKYFRFRQALIKKCQEWRYMICLREIWLETNRCLEIYS
jgi:hypothetical protein